MKDEIYLQCFCAFCISLTSALSERDTKRWKETMAFLLPAVTCTCGEKTPGVQRAASVSRSFCTWKGNLLS